MLHNESREFLVKMYDRTHDVGQTAKTFEVSQRQVYRIVKQYRETGSVAVRTSQRGRRPKLTSDDLERVEAIQEQPDITFGEPIERLQLDISKSRLGRIVREKLGYSRKKKVIHASETGASPMCSRNGQFACTEYEGGTTKERFLNYLQNTLLPSIHEGGCVIFTTVQPRFEPHRKNVGKDEGHLRKLRVRVKDQLIPAVHQALACVLPSDREGWFHCAGY